MKHYTLYRARQSRTRGLSFFVIGTKLLIPVQASFLNERKYTIYSYIMCVFSQKMSFHGKKMYIFVKNILDLLQGTIPPASDIWLKKTKSMR
jgi:hypothetical protein